MLILGRRTQESIHIGDNIVVKLIKIDKTSVQIGIEAPRDIVILREEIAPFELIKKFEKVR